MGGSMIPEDAYLTAEEVKRGRAPSQNRRTTIARQATIKALAWVVKEKLYPWEIESLLKEDI